MKRMQRAVLYARVSSDLQQKEGTIQSQVAELKRQIAAAGDVLVNEYIDDGFSGALLDRPAMNQLRDDLKADGERYAGNSILSISVASLSSARELFTRTYAKLSESDRAPPGQADEEESEDCHRDTASSYTALAWGPARCDLPRRFGLS